MAGGSGTTLLQQLRRLARPAGAGDTTDSQLLEQFVRQRDEAAFEALLRRHGPMVWGVCRRLLGNATDAEDAFQATFLVLVRKAGAVGRRELLANWLYGVARRTALKARTLRARRGRREQEGGAMAVRAAPAPTDRADLRLVLDDELARLGDRYRKPVVLCYLQGLTRQEAADFLGWPLGTVAGRLARALDLLRTRLGRHGLALSTAALAAEIAESAPAVPPALTAATVKAAAGVAAGSTTAAVPASVAVLTDGITKALGMQKMKLILVLLAAGVLSGAGVVAARGLFVAPGGDNGGPPSRRPDAQVAAADRRPAAQGKRPKSKGPRRVTPKEAEEMIRDYVFEKNPRFNREATFPVKEWTTADVWKRLGVQVFEVTGVAQQGALFVLKGETVFPIGPGGSCGNFPKSLCVADPDGSKRPKLLYTFSWGSGEYRSQLGLFDCLAKEPKESIAAEAYFSGPGLDLILKRIDDRTVEVHTPDVVVGTIAVEEKKGRLQVRIDWDKDLPKGIKKHFRPGGLRPRADR
jgi:RNA polymerase sigma factor (sigma-70 family)